MDLDDYKIRGVSLIATAIQHMSGTGNVFYRHTVEQRRNMMKVFVDLFAFVFSQDNTFNCPEKEIWKNVG